MSPGEEAAARQSQFFPRLGFRTKLFTSLNWPLKSVSGPEKYFISIDLSSVATSEERFLFLGCSLIPKLEEECVRKSQSKAKMKK